MLYYIFSQIINFLYVVNKIPAALKEEKFNKAEQIIQTFIATGAEQELNLNGSSKRDTLEQLNKLKVQRQEVLKKDVGEQRQLLIQQVEALEKLFSQLKRNVLFQLRDENFSDFLKSDFFKQQFQQITAPTPVPSEPQIEDKKKKKNTFSLLFVFKKSRSDEEEEAQPNSTKKSHSITSTTSNPSADTDKKPEFQKIQLKKAVQESTLGTSNKHLPPASDNEVLAKIEQMQDAAGAVKKHKKSVVNNRIQAFTALSENNQTTTTNNNTTSTGITRRRTDSVIQGSAKVSQTQKSIEQPTSTNQQQNKNCIIV